MFRNCFCTKELISKYGGIVTQTHQKSVVVRKRPTFKSRINKTGQLLPAHLQNNAFTLNQNKAKSFEKRMQFRTFNRWVLRNIFQDKINCICFCNQLSMGYVTKTEDMTTSVRFTGVPAQGKMNPLFIFHRNFFLLKFTGVPAQGKMNPLFIFHRNFLLPNLIEHAVD